MLNDLEYVIILGFCRDVRAPRYINYRGQQLG